MVDVHACVAAGPFAEMMRDAGGMAMYRYRCDVYGCARAEARHTHQWLANQVSTDGLWDGI